ncbi:butyrophilin-like protein 1 [Nelusetta ayraudi]|uniref:butyrophilin-like protein 1 n=1 Tax=Nelusetta ayraudi TaxID=303726 RepID=UPI003F6FED0E
MKWSWFNDISQKIVYAMHNGEELVKEKAPEYIGRTRLMSDGSLMLSEVQPQDNGSYRCLIVDKLQQISKVFATLTVAQVSTLNFTVRQTLASGLLVLCDATGWNPKPIVTLEGPLGANGPPTKIEVSTGANGLYSVQALAAMATQGSGI